MSRRSICRLLSSSLVVVVIAGCNLQTESPDRWISVRISAPGLSASEVEREMAGFAEESLKGISEIASMESVSRPGEVVVWLRLNPTADAYNVRSLVAERLQNVKSLDETGRPEMTSSSAGPLLLIALSSKTGDSMALRSTAGRLRKQLLLIPGVSQVSPFPDSTIVQIYVDANHLRSHGLTIDSVSKCFAPENVNPSDSPVAQREDLVSTSGTTVLDDLSQRPLTVRDDGSTIRLADVADVRLGWGHAVESNGHGWPSEWILIAVHVESLTRANACSQGIDDVINSEKLPPDLSSDRGLAAEHDMLLGVAVRAWESQLPPDIILRHTKSVEGHSQLTQVRADLCCRVTGPNIETLREASAEIVEQIRSHSDVAEARVYGDEHVPVMNLKLEAEKAAALGVDQDSVTRVARMAFGGQKIAQIRVDDVMTDVVIRVEPDQLSELSVQTPSGERIPLSTVCRISLDTEPSEIWHYERRRSICITVTARSDGVAMREALVDPITGIRDRLSRSDPEYQLHLSH